MYTICTGCYRQFRILAEQLTAAHGQVKCGYCGQQFDALIHLSDKPANPERVIFEAEQEIPVDDLLNQQNDDELINDLNNETGEQADESEQPAEEFSFHIPDEATVSDEAQADEDKSESEDQAVYSFADVSEQSSKEVPQEPESEPANDEPELSDAARETLQSGKVEATGEKQQAYEFPEDLMLDEPEPRRRIWPVVLWSLGCLLLLVIFAAQFAWFQRDELFQRYPQIYPYAIEMCEKLNCKIQRFEDLDAIEVLNRDVRLHPGYHDTLLVNATIVNQARLPMRFPVIQLTLFDLAGEVISYRKFEPDDYLDRSIRKEEGMLPEQPVHFALELTGKINNAVSFEFDFL